MNQCAKCGRGLCHDCASAPGGNLCRNCIEAYAEKVKSEKRPLLIRSIAIFAIVFVLCLSAPGAPFFVALLVPMALPERRATGAHATAYVPVSPYHWVAIYFGIKLFLSYWISSIAMPMQIVKAFRAARATEHTLAQ